MKNSSPITAQDIFAPLTAGFVQASVGFASSYVLVLEGLKKVGATDSQALSGLIALIISFCVGMCLLAFAHKVPMSMAWSTPAAALLLASPQPAGGFPVAVGAFIFAGLLTIASALIPFVGRAVSAIPVSLSQALLAGILLPLCLAPAMALAKSPGPILIILLVYVLTLWAAERWAVPAALAATLILALLSPQSQGRPAVTPSLEWVLPSFDVSTTLSLGFGIFIVTMAGQNLPGLGMLRHYGQPAPWRSSMLAAGGVSVLGAFAGGHASNLSALSAAITLGPMSGSHPRTRWWATPASALTYAVFAACAGALVSLTASAPEGSIATVAGLALLPTFASTSAGALTDRSTSAANAVVLLIAASGIVLWGLSSAVFAFSVGLLLHAIINLRQRRALARQEQP